MGYKPAFFSFSGDRERQTGNSAGRTERKWRNQTSGPNDGGCFNKLQ